jgi:hypothetical protein
MSLEIEVLTHDFVGAISTVTSLTEKVFVTVTLSHLIQQLRDSYHGTILTEGFHAFPACPGMCRNSTLLLGHNHFVFIRLYNPFIGPRPLFSCRKAATQTQNITIAQ